MPASLRLQTKLSTAGSKNVSLGSKSHWLLLFGWEVKVFGHFGDERVDFDIGEFEDSEGIDPVVEW